MEPSKSLAQLKKVITEMASQLEAYSKKENASTVYIERQNNTIRELVEVYNGFSQNPIKPYLLKVQTEITRLESLDSSLSGHQIMLRTKPQGNNFSLFYQNSYTND